MLCAVFPYHAVIGQIFTVVENNGLPVVGNAQAEWVDFDEDGWKDLIIAGSTKEGTSVFDVYHNNQDETFSAVGLPIAALENDRFLVGDFDNDNSLDIIYTGTDGAGNPQSYLLINNGSSFTTRSTSLPSVSRAKLGLIDFNQDGNDDIIITGKNILDETISQLWINNGSDFSQSSLTINELYRGVVAVADFNADGAEDFIISGENEEGFFETDFYQNNAGESISELIITTVANSLIQSVSINDYTGDGKVDLVATGRNSSFQPFVKLLRNTSSNFSELANGITILSSSASSLFDYDNDGDRDLVIYGLDAGNQYTTELYSNDGSGVFTSVSISVDGISNGAIAADDFNRDGQNDLVIMGFSDVDPTSSVINRLLLNENNISNLAPSIPNGLNAEAQDDSLTIGWNTSNDDFTVSNNVSYSIYLGTASGSVDIVSPGANLSNGKNWRTNTHTDTKEFRIIKNLPEGEYFWSVQAHDASGNSSAFAPEQSVIICHDPDLGENMQICENEKISLSAGTNADQVNWYSKKNGLVSSNQKTYEQIIVETDTIIVEVIKPLGCTVYDTLAIEMLPQPVTALPESEDVCKGEFVNYNLSLTDHTVNWYSTINGSIISDKDTVSYHVQENDTLVAEITNSDNCVLLDSIIINMIELPDLNPLVDTTICKNTIFEWSISGSFASSEWYSTTNGIVAQDVNSYSATYSNHDTLLITKENVTGCFNTDTVVINIRELPVVDLGEKQRICDGDSASISLAGDWSSLQWNSANKGLIASTENNFKWFVSENDTISVVATDQFGCVNYDTLIIEKLELPQFSLGTDTAICTGQSILLSVGSGFASVNWYSSKDGLLEQGDWFYEHTANRKDTIWAEVFNFNGCINYDTIVIDNIPIPNYDLGSNITLCQNEEVSISVQNLSDSVNWFINGELQDVHTEELTFMATDSVEVVSEFISLANCAGYDTIQVHVNPLPVVDLGTDRYVCQDDILPLSVPSFSSVQWESSKLGIIDEQVSEIELVTTQNDTIWVTVQDQYGCLSSDTIIVNIYELPLFSLGEDVISCAGDSITLSIDQPVDSINWFNSEGIIFSDTTAELSILPDHNISWWAEQWSSSGCVYRDTIMIAVESLPIFDAGDSLLICDDSGIELNPIDLQDGQTYSWTPSNSLSNATDANPVASPEDDTWYTLTVTNSNGCYYVDSVFVGIDNPVTINAGEDRTICLGGQTQLGGSPTASGSKFAYSYEWSPSTSLNDAFIANPQAFPQSTTEYRLIVRAGGCKADTAFVTVNVQEPPIVTVTADTTIGAGDIIQLEATGGDFYSWQPERGLSDASIPNPDASPVATTTYMVEVLDSLGCMTTMEVTVYVDNQLFIPNLFTPNGDGQNDAFLLYGAGFKELTFQVFDRAGKLLYQTDSPEVALTTGWDGTFNGVPVSDGVYVWVVKGVYYDGSPLRFQGKNSGIINLVR